MTRRTNRFDTSHDASSFIPQIAQRYASLSTSDSDSTLSVTA